MEVYARAHSVELLLDGRRLGRKVLRQYKALFRVRYAPGVLTAVARDEQGRETGRTVLRSAATPVHPVIRPETGSVRPGGLLFAAVNLEDASGVVESNGDRLLTVSAEGGRLLAFGSAAPCTKEAYHTGRFTTWYGRALAIVQAGESGQVVLTVRDGATTVQRSVPIQ